MTLPLIFLIKNEVDTQQDDSVSAAASEALFIWLVAGLDGAGFFAASWAIAAVGALVLLPLASGGGFGSFATKALNQGDGGRGPRLIHDPLVGVQWHIGVTPVQNRFPFDFRTFSPICN